MQSSCHPFVNYRRFFEENAPGSRLESPLATGRHGFPESKGTQFEASLGGVSEHRYL